MSIQSGHNWITVFVVMMVVLGLAIMAAGIVNLSFLGTQEGGVRGDFLGGHFGPAIGSWTLGVVIWTSYLQLSKQQDFFHTQRLDAENFFFRQAFTDGLNLIAQFDIKEPGCPQAMRLLDYYARVALIKKDDELLLLLNTVITDQIRRNLRVAAEDRSTRDNYMYAADAMERIGDIRKMEAKAHKLLKNSGQNPSTPSAPQVPKG